MVYDAAGNIINDGVGHSYTYDAEGRMTAVDGGSTATYLYDANGQRVEETIDGGAPIDFIYDVQGHMVTEATATVWDRSELYAGNNHVALYANGTTYFMHNDWLGSTKQQSDMSGNSAQWCSYLPFADGFNCPGSQLSLMSFTGDQWDGETGLSHTLFRQYNPTEGRWMTPDPAGMAAADPTNPQSWNRYAYVMNSPMNFTDPLGLCHMAAAAGAVTIMPDGSFGFSIDSVPCPNVDPGCLNMVNEQGEYLGEMCFGNVTVSGQGIYADFDTTNFYSTTTSSGNSTQCHTGPLNLSQNIQTSKSLAGQFWLGILNLNSPGGAASTGSAAGGYIGLVHTGGPWDPKNGPGGKTPENIAAGNINFGATCSQFGFNTKAGGFLCQIGAGLYQYHTDGHFESPFFSQYHGDVPRDNQQIRQGLAIAKNGGC